jgi:hypothetical protein
LRNCHDFDKFSASLTKLYLLVGIGAGSALLLIDKKIQRTIKMTTEHNDGQLLPRNGTKHLVTKPTLVVAAV